MQFSLVSPTLDRARDRCEKFADHTVRRHGDAMPRRQRQQPPVSSIFTRGYYSLTASAKMVAKGDIAAQYEAAAAAAAAAEGGVGERNMARSHSRGHPQEQRHSGGQQQQACDSGEGRAATNGHSVRHRLQAWVDGEDAPDVTTSGTNSVDEDYSYTSESDGTDDPPALKHHLPQAAPPPAPAPAEAAIVPFWHSVRQRLQARIDGEDAPDVTTSSSTDNSVDEDYSKSDGTDDPLALKHHLPQAAEPAAAAVPFLTNAQIRELSVRIKNATGDERTSRAIVQRLADAGVGVRVTESLEGVEVYVDALTEEVKASRASDERERECFLYRDKQGRLFNLVVAVSFFFPCWFHHGWVERLQLFFFSYVHVLTTSHHLSHISSHCREGQRKWHCLGRHRTAPTLAGWHVRHCPSSEGCLLILYTWARRMAIA